MENFPELFTSLSNSHKPHLACVSLSSLLSIQFHKTTEEWFHKKSGVVAFVLSERSILNGFIGSYPSFFPIVRS